jgi:hypothetical protein
MFDHLWLFAAVRFRLMVVAQVIMNTSGHLAGLLPLSFTPFFTPFFTP